MHDQESPSVEEFNAIFAEACENHQNGNYQEAMEGYQKLIQFFPGAPILHYNLGLLFFETEHFNEAVAAFSHAAEANPEDADILFNLALSYRKIGDFGSAIDGYVRALELEPGSVDALYNLAGCYREDKNYDSAVQAYLKVLDLDAEHLSAANNLAYVYQRLGDQEKAVTYYKRVLELDPDHGPAAHMVAALTGDEVTSSPLDYVKDVFDNYSDHYEKSLVQELEYNVPDKIKNVVLELDRFVDGFSYGLDLGCGTGLSGEAFATLVARMDGVDLATKMIEIAESKDVYNKLSVVGIEEYLEGGGGPFDFVLAADVFGYVGELKRVFSLLQGVTAENVLFCFSTELLDGDGFLLQQTGRFAHSRGYIETLAGKTGWKIAHSQASNLRKERGNWIGGTLWFMEKARS